MMQDPEQPPLADPEKVQVLPQRNGDLIALLVLLALAAALRLSWADQPLIDAFSWRQASTAMIAHNIPLNNWNIFFPEVDWTGPGPSYQGREFQIYTLIVAIVQTLTGLTDMAGRLVSTVFGLLTVFALHRFTAIAWDELHAHAAALVYALMPAAVMMDSSFLPDATMLALLTTGLWLFVLYFQGAGTKMLVLAAIAFALGVLAKLPGLGAGLVVAFLVLTLWLRGERQRTVHALVAIVAVLAAVIGYYAWAIYMGNSYPPYHVAGSGYIWEFGFWGFWERQFFLPELGDIAQGWFYGWPILTLAALGLWLHPSATQLAPGRDPVLVWCASLWLLSAVIVYLAAAREISNNPWNLHLFSVPIAMFAGAGIIALLRLNAEQSWPGLATRVLAVMLAIFAFSTVPLTGSMKSPYAARSHALGLEMAARRAAGDLVVAIGADVGDPISIYYAGAKGWVFPPGGGKQTWSVFFEDDTRPREVLEALRAEGAVWFGYTTDARDDLGRLFVEHHRGFIEWLDTNHEKVVATDDFVLYRL